VAVVGAAFVATVPGRPAIAGRVALVALATGLWLGSTGTRPVVATLGDLPPAKRGLYERIVAQTPPGARVVVPPFGFDDLTAFTGRSAMGTWKEGATMMWSPGFARVWLERLRRSGLPVRPGRYLRRDAGAMREAYRRAAASGALAEAWRGRADALVVPVGDGFALVRP
jgi:hypothetical protein